jgi:hypothetical protein
MPLRTASPEHLRSTEKHRDRVYHKRGMKRSIYCLQNKNISGSSADRVPKWRGWRP